MYPYKVLFVVLLAISILGLIAFYLFGDNGWKRAKKNRLNIVE